MKTMVGLIIGLSLFYLSIVNGQFQLPNYGSFGNATGICQITGLPPAKNKFYYSFCNQYQGLSCCSLGQEEDIEAGWYQLTDVGTHCPYKNKGSVYPLFQWICMACDPYVPTYQEPGDACVIRVCQSFIDKLWGDGTLYDDCGLRVAVRGPEGTCSSYDPAQFSCGLSVQIPSTTFPNATSFMTTVAPYLIGPADAGCSFIVYNGTEPCFDPASSLQSNVFLLVFLLGLALILQAL